MFARTFGTQKLTVRALSLIAAFLCGSGAWASGISYHGRLLNPDGTPVTDASVQFKMAILTPDSQSCLMYEEIQTKNLSNTSGAFSITINDGTGTRTDSSGYTFDQVFGNIGTLTFAPATCSSGTGSYTPATGDGRTFQVYFETSTMSSWEPMPPQSINFSPFAIEAKQVSGFPAASLLRVQQASGAPGTATPLSPTDFTNLQTLLAGTSTQYVQSGTNGAPIPSMASNPGTPSAGDIWFNSTSKTLDYYDGTAVQTVGTGSGAGTVTSVATGTGLTGGPITSSGTISLATVGTAGTYTKVTTDAYGRVTAGTQITGNDITSGTIGGSTSMSTTGSVSAASVSSTTDSTNNLWIYEGTNTHKVKITAPASLSADYGLTLPTTEPAANGYMLISDTSGNLSWAAPSGGSVTSVAMTVPSILAVTGSPITTSGTLAVTLANETANTVFAAPNGSTGAPSFRTLAAADIPNLDWSKITTGLPTTLAGYGITDAVKNAGGAVSVQEGADTSKPAAGTAGRIYIASDTFKIYRDNGTSWDLIASTLTTTGATGAYINGGNSFGQAATLGTNDGYTLGFKTNGTTQMTIDTAGHVGIGSSSPGSPLTISSSVTSGYVVSAADTAGSGTASVVYGTTNTTDSSGAWVAGVSGSITGAGNYGSGVYGTNSGTGNHGFGGYFLTNSTSTAADAAGVSGIINGASNNGFGVIGQNTGSGNTGYGGFFQNNSTDTSSTAAAVAADMTGSGNNGFAVLGQNLGTTNTGYAGFFKNTSTSSGVGIYATETGAGNAGSALQVVNNSTTGWGVYSSGTSPNYFAGDVGVGTTSPTAALQLKAGVATAGGAPLKLTAGTSLTTPEPGAIEYDGTSLFYTDSSSVRHTLAAAGAGITALTGDVSASGSGSVAATVNSVGGSTAANVHTAEVAANAATNLNTASTIVKRDASGNFSAGAVSVESGIFRDTGSNTVTLEAPTTVTSYVLNLPAAQGGANTVLTNDGSGNLSWLAPTVGGAATLSTGDIWVGNGSNVATAVAMSGDATLASSGTLTLASSGVTAATYGSATQVPQIAVDAKGRITSASNVSIPTATGAQLGLMEVGTGLSVAAGVVSVASTGATGAYLNGGNSFGQAATLGTNDAYTLGFKTNGTTQMTIDTAGNVGIGTTSPGGLFSVGSSSQFQVDSSGNVTAAGATPGSAGITSGNGLMATGSENTLYNSSSSTINWPYSGAGRSSTLIIANNQSLDGVAGFTQYITYNTVGNSQNAYVGAVSSTGAGVYSPSLVFGAQTGSTAYNERMRIDPSGNVGIGTTSPSTKLDLYVPTQFDGLTLRNASNVIALLQGEDSTPSNDSGSLTLFSQGSANVQILSNGNGTYFNAGDVGIGTTSPGYPLDVANTIRVSGSSGWPALRLEASNDNTGQGAIVFQAGRSNNTAYPQLGDWLGQMSFTNQNTAQSVTFEAIATENQSSTAAGGALAINTTANGTTTLTERMRIDNNGNVGIGTVSPTAKLNVAGAIVSNPTDISSGASVDLSLGNTFTLDSLGTSTITLSNMVNGGNYTLVITDTASRFYVFSGCTSSYYSPANASTTTGTQSIYRILTIQSGTNWKCYVTWATGYQ